MIILNTMTDDGENQKRKGLEDYCVEQGLG